jgi:hypothetical protein
MRANLNVKTTFGIPSPLLFFKFYFSTCSCRWQPVPLVHMSHMDYECSTRISLHVTAILTPIEVIPFLDDVKGGVLLVDSELAGIAPASCISLFSTPNATLNGPDIRE